MELAPTDHLLDIRRAGYCLSRPQPPLFSRFRRLVGRAERLQCPMDNDSHSHRSLRPLVNQPLRDLRSQSPHEWPAVNFKERWKTDYHGNVSCHSARLTCSISHMTLTGKKTKSAKNNARWVRAMLCDLLESPKRSEAAATIVMGREAASGTREECRSLTCKIRRGGTQGYHNPLCSGVPVAFLS
jgi:hypothetical protein